MALYMYQISYTSEAAAAGLALVVAGSGATKAGKTTRLLSGQEWIESLRRAQGSSYRPPQ